MPQSYFLIISMRLRGITNTKSLNIFSNVITNILHNFSIKCYSPIPSNAYLNNLTVRNKQFSSVKLFDGLRGKLYDYCLPISNLSISNKDSFLANFNGSTFAMFLRLLLLHN